MKVDSDDNRGEIPSLSPSPSHTGRIRVARRFTTPVLDFALLEQGLTYERAGPGCDRTSVVPVGLGGECVSRRIDETFLSSP